MIYGFFFEVIGSDGHQTTMPISFLKQYAYDPPLEKKNKDVGGRTERTLWNRLIENKMPTVEFDSLFQEGDSGERAVLEWLSKIVSRSFPPPFFSSHLHSKLSIEALRILIHGTSSVFFFSFFLLLFFFFSVASIWILLGGWCTLGTGHD